MPHTLTSGMLAATLADNKCPIFLAEIDTPDGNAYIWTGYGPLSFNGQTFSGAGEFGAISPTTESTDLTAQGVSLSLNGFDIALLNLAIGSLARFYPCKCWLGMLDTTTFELIADPYMFHYGLIDTASVAADGKTASITITSETRLIAMKQPRERRFTDADQRIECPGDGGFKFVDFVQNYIANWGGAVPIGQNAIFGPVYRALSGLTGT